MLRRRFKELGLKASVEEFSYDIRPALWVLRIVLIASGLLVLAASITLASSPFLGATLLVCALVPGLIFLAWAPWLERLYRRDGPTRTANVLGRRAVAHPNTRLIVMAHHDSKSQSLTLPFRAGFTAMVMVGVLSLTGVVVAALAIGSVPGPPWLAPASGSLAAFAAIILSTMTSGNRSPGGVDNAGSVAILLELARVLPGEVDDGVELIFLSTGAEEDHMVGAMRWLDDHADELAGRPVYCLNFDGAGSPGRLVLLERFGFGKMFSPEMSRAARRAAARLGLRIRGIVTPPAMGIDAIPFIHRGVPCLTIASGSVGRATLAVHSAEDRAELLDAETLEAAARLGFETLLELANDQRT